MAATTPASRVVRPPSTNPFATRNVRPGAIPFHFPSGLSADLLADRLREKGWRAQILGQHGAGKTTLLRTLLPVFETRGRQIVFIECRAGQRSLPRLLPPIGQWTPETLVVVDGYEQLGFWTRLWLNWRCHKVGCGLLVTTHRPFGLPTLYHVVPELETVEEIVRQLQDSHPSAISSDSVSQHFADQSGNVRELFFRLYDLYEKRRDH